MDLVFVFKIIALVGACGALAYLFFKDWTTQLLPDRVVFPLALLGGVVAFVAPVGAVTLTDSLVGAGLGLIAMAFIRWLGTRLMRQEAMGFGDVKFVGMAGLWIGWQGLNPLIVIGTLLSLSFFLIRRWVVRSPDGLRHAELPLGPGLCVALAGLILLNQAGIQIGPGFMPL